MVSKRNAVCAENEGLAAFLFEKWEEMAAQDKFTERMGATLSTAYKNLCDHKDPILHLKGARNVKGIGNWTLELMKDYFESNVNEHPSSQEVLEPRVKKSRGSGRYLPQKSSAPYAILIALYRGTQNEKEYMLKQELIDAAEASGLSKLAIGPSKSSANPGRFGNQPKEWYSGWSSMKTLIAKGLVVKSSSPAKYMLTEEGKITGKECLERSGLLNDGPPQICSQQITEVVSSVKGVCTGTSSLSKHREEDNIILGATKQGNNACHAKMKVPASREIRSRPSVATEFVDKEQAETSSLQLKQSFRKELHPCSVPNKTADLGEDDLRKSLQTEPTKTSNLSHNTELFSSTLRACTFSSLSHHHHKNSDPNPDRVNTNVLATPPLGNSDRFSDLYDVVLILDDREQFGRDSQGAHSRQKVADRLISQFKIQVERCGLQRLIYLIEGDANLTDASESIKSAAFTTEILEGFDVQRTRDLADTVRKYGYLTLSIEDYYNIAGRVTGNEMDKPCMTYDEFVTKCRDLDKETVSDVFGVQLMQVPQVTEDVALAVLDRYPSVLSLAQAYSRLEGNHDAQEKLLKEIPIHNQSKIIGGIISKNIYKFIWGEGT
ncbi:crossover junction endonuclease MUS81 isoform X2 [Cryptomeria japonica]|uniref:crossover junction endonuclease MUS81 isoform X2 n=1 Tax=Cryptomeria japonica TaxID=3369 RepID=UPI0027DA0214|nr:crossover junction endonuclease MUS81 isoform X2 [Cryptomeria japonica]